MRKNSPRKWLHACLDLLPVILIPVFMIYSHRHEINDGSIQVPQNQVVDFNQQVKNGNFESVDYWRPFNGSYVSLTSETDGGAVVVVGNTSNAPYNYGIFQEVQSSIIGHVYLFKVDFSSSDFNNMKLDDFGGNQYFNNGIITWTANSVQSGVLVSPSNVVDVAIGDTYTIHSFMFFDLTQMFGSGNEPTAQQFNEWYSNEYYSYTLSHKELLKNTSTITYSDTDIMSQFTYQLYNSVDKYFNMGNVFNMTSVYDWFNLNIFGGNAPISIYIVWNIVLYEFVMDLLFLLYGLFMWFIDMVEHIMDKPFKSIK